MADTKPSSPAQPPPRPAPANSTMVGGGVGIPAAAIIVWAVQTFGHVTVPPEIAAAFGAVLAAGTGYFHSVASK